MTMKNKCYDAQQNGKYDSAGNPIMVRVCYCGTSGCTQLQKNDYPLPRDLTTEASEEEEKRFYKKVFSSIQRI